MVRLCSQGTPTIRSVPGVLCRGHRSFGVRPRRRAIDDDTTSYVTTMLTMQNCIPYGARSGQDILADQCSNGTKRSFQSVMYNPPVHSNLPRNHKSADELTPISA